MSTCTGLGECLQQCGCGCFDDEDDKITSTVCSCGHRDHLKFIGGTTDCDIYCKSECPHNCQLVECHNFRLCGQKRPQWLLYCHNRMCPDCAIMIGRVKFLDLKGDCPVCLENKDMIEITCGKHAVCLNCWKEWSTTSKESPLTCPLCRESIWKWKGR